MVKKPSAFASIYLLASLMYCNLFFLGGGNSYLFFAKITRVVFSWLRNTTFFAYKPSPISLYHK